MLAGDGASHCDRVRRHRSTDPDTFHCAVDLAHKWDTHREPGDTVTVLLSHPGPVNSAYVEPGYTGPLASPVPGSFNSDTNDGAYVRPGDAVALAGPVRPTTLPPASAITPPR